MIDKDKERERKRRWYHNHKASKQASKEPSKSLDVSPSEPSGISKLRLHALSLKFRFTKLLDYDTLPAISTIKLRKMDNGFLGFEDQGIKGRLTRQSLTLWAKESEIPLTASLGEMEAEQISILFDEAEKLAQRLNLELESGIGLLPEGRLSQSSDTKQVRPSDSELIAEIIEEHIAHTNDAGATEAIAQKHPIKILNQVDGRTRFLVDASKGIPEAEFVHRRHAKPDMEKYAEMVKEVTQQNAWQELKEIIKEQNKFFVTHNKLMADIDVLVKKLDAKLSLNDENIQPTRADAISDDYVTFMSRVSERLLNWIKRRFR